MAVNRDPPSIAGRIRRISGKGGAIHQQLFRNASPNHAGTARAAFLDHGHAGTMSRGNTRGAHAAGTGADHYQVEIMHGVGLSA